MSSKTTNFNLHKIDLTDTPPDITVLNQNWDTIDQELMKDRSFEVTVTEDGDYFKANKTFNEVLAAYNTGRNIVAFYASYKCQLTEVNTSGYFAFAAPKDAGTVMFAILSDNTVAVDFQSFARTQHRHSANDILGLAASDVGITAGTAGLTANSSALETNHIYLQYE